MMSSTPSTPGVNSVTLQGNVASTDPTSVSDSAAAGTLADTTPSLTILDYFTTAGSRTPRAICCQQNQPPVFSVVQTLINTLTPQVGHTDHVPAVSKFLADADSLQETIQFG